MLRAVFSDGYTLPYRPASPRIDYVYAACKRQQPKTAFCLNYIQSRTQTQYAAPMLDPFPLPNAVPGDYFSPLSLNPSAKRLAGNFGFIAPFSYYGVARTLSAAGDVDPTTGLIDPYSLPATTTDVVQTSSGGPTSPTTAPAIKSWLSDGWKIIGGSAAAAIVFGIIIGRVSK